MRLHRHTGCGIDFKTETMIIASETDDGPVEITMSLKRAEALMVDLGKAFVSARPPDGRIVETCEVRSADAQISPFGDQILARLEVEDGVQVLLSFPTHLATQLAAKIQAESIRTPEPGQSGTA